MKVVVFSLVKDRCEITKKSFTSLQNKTVTPFTHIVVNQGSDLQTRVYLENYKYLNSNVELINLEENVGISRGTNIALDKAAEFHPDIIAKFDNDCEIIDDGALDYCFNIVAAMPDVVVSPYVDGLVQNKGGSPRYAVDTTHNLGFVYHLGGIVTVGSRKTWATFGRHTVPAPLHGNQDSEFSTRVRAAGFSLAYVEEVKVLHLDKVEDSQYPEYHEKRKEEKVTVL